METRLSSRAAAKPNRSRSSEWRRYFRRGASWALGLGLIVLACVIGYVFASPYGPGAVFASTAVHLAAAMLASAVLVFVGKLLGKLPTQHLWMIISLLTLYVLVVMYSYSALLGALMVFLAMVVGLPLLGGGLYAMGRHGWSSMTRLQRSVTAAGLAVSLVVLILVGALLLGDGTPANRSALSPQGPGLRALTAPDPTLVGPYPVLTLTYGSGTDRHRPEYGETVHLTTPTFDASPLVSGWSSRRTRYWGFGPESVPLNARVWYPQGEGPFPLILMAHGNAEMTRGSDRGYEYLGELLASRGYIFASVDENFLNGSGWADLLYFHSIQGENDVRALLLLEHLRQWRAWNESPDNPFHGKVDMGRIAMGGHSRGGEAVAIAAVLNRLAHYPDDANIQFDYGFDIKAIFALAPTEGQYTPANRPLVVQDVNYLVLHGAHDMDVFTFMGAAQFDRVHLLQDEFTLKSAVYIEQANHGQFNTVWGRNDLPSPAIWLFNRAQLLPPEEQRQIAKVYISAFLDATLRQQREYLPLFQDARVAAQWLPATGYLNRYEDTATVYLSTFDEDLDPGTTSLPGGRLLGDGLTVWREGTVPGKWGDLDRHAVFVGWDHTEHPEPKYTLTMPTDALTLGAGDVLVFDMADGSGKSSAESLDFSVEVTDRSGERARWTLSEAGYGRFAIDSTITKARWMNVLFPSTENVFQTVSLPLALIAERNPQLNIGELQSIAFIFNRTPEGSIALDRIGIRRAPTATPEEEDALE